MLKLGASIKKEILLLAKDKGGLLILFIMPAILIITVTLIQKESFEKIADTPIDILLIDQDKDSISAQVISKLNQNQNFILTKQIDGKELTEEKAKQLVFNGQYKMALIIPKNLTSAIQQNINVKVSKVLSEFGATEIDSNQKDIVIENVRLYFDPAIQSQYKNSIISSFQKEIKSIENAYIFKSFQENLGTESSSSFTQKELVAVDEILPPHQKKDFVPTAVSHNVPAWTLFAIFFICIPLSINIIKEKNQGIYMRLKTMPINYLTIVGGKTITYLMICILQFWLMLMIGVYIFPLFGLSKFMIDTHFLDLTIVAIFSGLAAIGIGIIIGTVAKTQEQAAPFGATLTIILAAIGGVWIPIFAMPKFMQTISNVSPMKWGIEAFYDVLLRNSTLISILPLLLASLLLYILLILASIIYEKRQLN